MKFNEGVEVEEVPACLLCQRKGTPLYRDLRDRLFGAPGLWGIDYCPHCRFGWLNPRPSPAGIARVYETYYTHAPFERRRSALGLLKRQVEGAVLNAEFGYPLPSGKGSGGVREWALRHLPMAREVAGSGIMWLTRQAQEKLLDVGCGNGEFLVTMQGLGWQVTGVEPDPRAAALASERLSCSIASDIQTLDAADGAFDAVTAHEVIEHMHDPAGFLGEAFRVLSPGGRLVVTTPNIQSLGHKIFGKHWRELEPPRHLHLFSARALKACAVAQGFQIEVLRGSARSAWEIWYASREIRRKGEMLEHFKHSLNPLLRLEGLAYQLVENLVLPSSPGRGENLVLIATKMKKV